MKHLSRCLEHGGCSKMIVTNTEQREENKSEGKKKGKAERRGRGRPMRSGTSEPESLQVEE